MAFLAKVFFSGDGSTDLFTITFDFQENVDVVVTVDGVVQVEDTDYTISGTTLTFLAGSIPASGTDNIEIRRSTTTVPRVDFANSGIITEAKLDRQNLQNSYIVEETKDELDSKIGLDAENNIDAESAKIVNVDDPTESQDAATKAYVDAVALGSFPSPLGVSEGGTGATTATGARANLDVPSNADLTAVETDVATLELQAQDLDFVTDPSGARVNIGAQQNVMTAQGDIVTGGSGGLAQRLALGSNGQVLKSDGTDAVWADRPVSSAVQVASAVAAHDFTDIPAWAKRITLRVVGGSTNGTSPPTVQIGDAGGIENSGYLGTISLLTASPLAANISIGFNLVANHIATGVLHGKIILTLVDAANFTWEATSSIGRSDAAALFLMAGSRSLSSALTQIRLTTTGGTNVFDTGTFSILYE